MWPWLASERVTRQSFCFSNHLYGLMYTSIFCLPLFRWGGGLTVVLRIEHENILSSICKRPEARESITKRTKKVEAAREPIWPCLRRLRLTSWHGVDLALVDSVSGGIRGPQRHEWDECPDKGNKRHCIRCSLKTTLVVDAVSLVSPAFPYSSAHAGRRRLLFPNPALHAL